jgi:hypothetical protein
MSWLIAVSVVLFVIVLTRAFILNARAIKRDMNKRFDELRARLERDANSVVDEFLKGNAHERNDRSPGGTR